MFLVVSDFISNYRTAKFVNIGICQYFGDFSPSSKLGGYMQNNVVTNHQDFPFEYVFTMPSSVQNERHLTSYQIDC